MCRAFRFFPLAFLTACVVADETNPSLQDSWETREAKAIEFEGKLWEEHRGFPTFSTTTLPEQRIREVFLAFAALVPDGAYVLGPETRFVIEYEYSNVQRLGQLRTATYRVLWKDRTSGEILYQGEAATVCQFTSAIIARPPDCEDLKQMLLLTALTEMK